MASTIQLSNTINWAQAFLAYAPVTIGTGSEPAVSSANTILQTILAPPFAWRWNRSTLTFNTVIGTQDYTSASATFGFIEQATAALTGAQTYPLEIKSVLGEATEQSRPTFISTQKDDDAGNISFRLLPIPDQVYTVTITFQKQPVLFTNVSSPWAPIPDYLAYIYNWGFLSLMLDYVDSSKSQRMRQLFVASLLSVSEGLEEAERNLFVASWLGETRQIQSSQMDTQTGQKARSV